MTSLRSSIGTGLAAGAAGTTALNTITNLDMAVRARPASEAPQQTMAAAAERLRIDIPGHGRERANRLAGLGPASGAVSGVLVGGLGGALHAAGVRLPALLDAALLGGTAMALTDVPLALLGISDPRRWSGATWAMDAAFHFGYGLAAHAVLARADRAEAETARHPARPAAGPKQAMATGGAALRSLAIGAASGGRSMAGLAAVSLSSPRASSPARQARRVGAVLGHPLVRIGTGLLSAGEVAFDKTGVAPPRLGASGLPGRVAGGAVSAGALARRHRLDSGPQAVLGAIGACGAACLGQFWRDRAHRRFGFDLPGALIEDAATATLASLACRKRRER